MNTDSGRDVLIEALEEDARTRAAELVEEAERDAERVVEGARAEAEEARKTRLREAGGAAERARDSRIAEARVRAEAEKLKARRSSVDRVMKEALKRLGVLPRDKKRHIFNSLVDELKGIFPEGKKPVAVVNPADRPLAEETGLKVRTDPGVSGGVVFESEDGSVRFVNTLESRLAKAGRELVPELDRLLFG